MLIEDGSEYLLIECKVYGKEFEKEFKRMNKDGGNYSPTLNLAINQI